jgi:protein-tyrosine kinase
MSKFFQALKRAEQDHILRRERVERGPVGTTQEVRSQRPGVSLLGEERQKQGSQRDELQVPKPVMGFPRDIDQHLVSFLAPTTFEAEQYRSLRHTIEQVHRDTGALSLIAISSPAVGDGKTTTAINLAGTLAQNSEIRVLLIDMDLRHPSMVRTLGLHHVASPGLVDVITNPNLSLEAVAFSYLRPNLSIIPAGCSLANPYEVLKSHRLGELLEEARQSYDYVVIDTPPLIPFPDCRLLSRWVDGFLVVVTAHRTPRKLLEEALNIMEPTKITGLVFNSDDQPVFGYYHSYYAYDSAGGSATATGPLSRVMKKISHAWRRRGASQRRRTSSS